MKRNFIFLFTLCIGLFYNCKNNFGVKGFDYGSVENSTYKNSYFNFEMNLPPTWVVQSKEQTEMIVETGKKIAAGDNENLKTMIKASEVNSAYLLTVFKHELGTAVPYNPNIMILAENLKMSPGVKKGNDYLYHASRILKQSQVNYNHIDSTFDKLNFDNKEFYIMNAILNHPNLELKQSYYTTIINGFALSFVISYASDEQKKELNSILESIKFID